MALLVVASASVLVLGVPPVVLAVPGLAAVLLAVRVEEGPQLELELSLRSKHVELGLQRFQGLPHLPVCLDFKDGKLYPNQRPGLGVELDYKHAFANIALTDNVVRFATRWYCENPLIVQGPGAGPEVTAGGVFSDLLRLAAYLGARL